MLKLNKFSQQLPSFRTKRLQVLPNKLEQTHASSDLLRTLCWCDPQIGPCSQTRRNWAKLLKLLKCHVFSVSSTFHDALSTNNWRFFCIAVIYHFPKSWCLSELAALDGTELASRCVRSALKCFQTFSDTTISTWCNYSRRHALTLIIIDPTDLHNGLWRS